MLPPDATNAPSSMTPTLLCATPRRGPADPFPTPINCFACRIARSAAGALISALAAELHRRCDVRPDGVEVLIDPDVLVREIIRRVSRSDVDTLDSGPRQHGHVGPRVESA